MLVFRSFAIGLSAACFALLCMQPSVVVVREEVAAAPTAPAPAIIDVAPGVSIDQLPTLIRLAPGEQISSVDSLELVRLDRHRNQFVDLMVAGPAGERRVLLLLH